jgi:hypothetical protein
MLKDFYMIPDGFHSSMMYTARGMAGCDGVCCDYGYLIGTKKDFAGL